MSDNRRDDICDAAIRVLSAGGSRGLSHHKVDAEAGLAKGSTSYYFRTRLALLEATMKRVNALDQSDIQKAISQGQDPFMIMSSLIHNWLCEPDLTRTRARQELFLIASREPKIEAIISQTRELITASMLTLTRQLSPSTLSDQDALSITRTGMWMAEGLMSTVVRENIAPPPMRDIRAMLERNLRSAYGKVEV